MTQCKKSIMDGSILRNITLYKPILYKKKDSQESTNL